MCVFQAFETSVLGHTRCLTPASKPDSTILRTVLHTVLPRRQKRSHFIRPRVCVNAEPAMVAANILELAMLEDDVLPLLQGEDVDDLAPAPGLASQL